MSVPLFSEPVVAVSPVERALALAAVVRATRLVRRPPEQIAARLRRSVARRSAASSSEAERARQVVCAVSVRCRGSQGCVLRSVATVLYCGLRRRSLTWCTGFALEPFRAHAWVEVSGAPIGELPEVSGYHVALNSADDRFEMRSSR